VVGPREVDDLDAFGHESRAEGVVDANQGSSEPAGPGGGGSRTTRARVEGREVIEPGGDPAVDRPQRRGAG